MDERVITTTSVKWIDPDEPHPLNPPPKGVKMRLLLFTGVDITGQWRDNAGYVGWLPHPKIPPSIKRKMENYAEYSKALGGDKGKRN